jgi:hypothetical protein
MIVLSGMAQQEDDGTQKAQEVGSQTSFLVLLAFCLVLFVHLPLLFGKALPVILMISFSVVAWYKLGLRKSFDSLFCKQRNIFLDHGGFARCENIISRSCRRSC